MLVSRLRFFACCFETRANVRQSATLFRRAQLSAPGGRFPLSAPSSSLWTRNGKNTRENGQAVSSAVSLYFISAFDLHHQRYMLLTSARFVVIASTRDMSRKVFNSPSFVKPCVVDVAHKLLGATNWVFLDGKAHVDFRKGLNCLFTRKALETYLPGQEEVYKVYFERFLRVSEEAKMAPVPFMAEFREVMCAVSCRTFVGHYISDEAIKQIADDYYNITAALELVNFPFIIPYTKTWYGKKAADMVLEEFSKCAAKSKVRMAAGGEIGCIMDGWVSSQLESARWREREAKGLPMEGLEKPSPLLREFTDYEIAQTVFTFLFASQDATSSAATWLFQIMAQRPDCLDKIREEQLRARGGDREKPITMDMFDELPYTRAVVKETLRYRPPVIMVPYLAKKAFPITDSYTVPKGMHPPWILSWIMLTLIRCNDHSQCIPISPRSRSLHQPR